MPSSSVVSFGMDAVEAYLVGLVRLLSWVVGVVIVASTSSVADHDPGGSIETVHQGVSDDPERRKSHPTSLDRAGSRHAVAFAFLSHLSLNMLK